jgi:hypothetical protein
MDGIGWSMLGVGATIFLLGLVAVLGLVSGLPRYEGRGAVAFGGGAMLVAIARSRYLPGEDWVVFVGTFCIVAGVVFEWRSHWRMKGTYTQPPARPSQ